MHDKGRDTWEWEETDFLDDDNPRVQAAMAAQAAAAQAAAAQAAAANHMEETTGESPQSPDLEPWKQGMEALFDPATIRALKSVHDIADPRTRYSRIAHQYRCAYKNRL